MRLITELKIKLNELNRALETPTPRLFLMMLICFLIVLQIFALTISYLAMPGFKLNTGIAKNFHFIQGAIAVLSVMHLQRATGRNSKGYQPGVMGFVYAGLATWLLTVYVSSIEIILPKNATLFEEMALYAPLTLLILQVTAFLEYITIRYKNIENGIYTVFLALCFCSMLVTKLHAGAGPTAQHASALFLGILGWFEFSKLINAKDIVIDN